MRAESSHRRTLCGDSGASRGTPEWSEISGASQPCCTTSPMHHATTQLGPEPKLHTTKGAKHNVQHATCSVAGCRDRVDVQHTVQRATRATPALGLRSAGPRAGYSRYSAGVLWVLGRGTLGTRAALCSTSAIDVSCCSSTSSACVDIVFHCPWIVPAVHDCRARGVSTATACQPCSYQP